MKRSKITNLLIFIVSAELVGVLSAVVSGGNFKAFYSSLNQPPFAPPAWLFPVAWGILYALMGISAFLIDESGHDLKQKALVIYWVQLFVNFLWSPVFFGFKSLTGAVVVIVLLLMAVSVMILTFWKIRKSSAYLNIPYILWVAYATYLTIGVRALN
ncbi:MAG TPA: tryptophan-rich sensory protein [Ruminococcus sp.]|nr:tryptophan-rich sensory protein [Ruminococcus sp.]